MRIESQGVSAIPASQPPQRATPADRAQPAGREAVQLSAAGQLVSVARQALRDAPDVREKQVRQFASQMAAGNYRPDPEAIAGAIIPG